MRTLRIIGIVLAVLIALGAIGGGLAFYFTRGAATAADAFFQAIAKDGPDAAYNQAAPSFRATTSRDAFAQAIEQLGLRGYTSASWDSRSVENARASLEGALALAGGSLPVKVQLAKGDDGIWRVLVLSLPNAGLERTGAAAPAPPSAAEAHLLAQVSFMQLAEAIKARNFQAIRLATTPGFQQEFSTEQLAQQFKPFTDHNVDLTRADTSQMSFDPSPHMDDKGSLVLKGRQPTPERPWWFAFTYARTARGWTLTGMTLSTSPD